MLWIAVDTNQKVIKFDNLFNWNYVLQVFIIIFILLSFIFTHFIVELRRLTYMIHLMTFSLLPSFGSIMYYNKVQYCIDTHACTHTHTHTYIYICMCVCSCGCVCQCNIALLHTTLLNQETAAVKRSLKVSFKRASVA